MLLIGQIAYIWYCFFCFFWYIAYYAADIPFVGDNLYDWFSNISHQFFEVDGDGNVIETCLYARTIELGEWCDDVIDTLKTILSLDTIWDYIKAKLPKIELLVVWFSEWWEHILAKVTEWWEAEDNPIRLFIGTATEGLDTLLTAWSDFQLIWDDFWTITWPELTTTLETFFTETLPTLFDIKVAEEWWTGKAKVVSDLIDTALKEWFPDYDDLVKLWDRTKLFFTDPVEFLWARFTDWFLGPEV